MEKINVLIIEDELLIAEDLKAQLEDHNFDVRAILDEGEQALKHIQNEIPDLILMDIQLAGNLDGIDTAQEISKVYSIPIIYLSDHVDEATVNRAKRTHPAGYLSKPYKSGDVLRALEVAFANIQQQKSYHNSKLSDRIFIRMDHQTSEMILYKDILYLEADRSYSYLVTESKKYTLSSSMNKVFSQLESHDFLRVHRSFVVNINRITGVEGNILRLGAKHSVTMSPKNRTSVLSKINFIK